MQQLDRHVNSSATFGLLLRISLLTVILLTPILLINLSGYIWSIESTWIQLPLLSFRLSLGEGLRFGPFIADARPTATFQDIYASSIMCYKLCMPLAVLSTAWWPVRHWFAAELTGEERLKNRFISWLFPNSQDSSVFLTAISFTKFVTVAFYFFWLVLSFVAHFFIPSSPNDPGGVWQFLATIFTIVVTLPMLILAPLGTILLNLLLPIYGLLGLGIVLKIFPYKSKD